MMDELKQQFYEVMHKYQKPFSEEGVAANLTQWYEQKQGLLQLLRKHPLWNEKELAIVFRVEERREIDRITVDETRAAILELGRRACTDDTVYENFEVALRAATADYARIPNEYRLDTIRQYGGIKCAPGQKASRIINRLCLKFHLDQIEEEAEAGEPDNRYTRTIKPYNALFARLADALNPAHIEKTAVLSIHPCDFLEMSNRDNTWSSCHCLEGGGYRGGCQSYMGDAVSMIFFTVSDEYTQDFHTAPRITREIFCYKDNVLLQSRLYPTDLEDQKTLYRSIVQQAIATCLDKPNLWSLKRGKDTEPYCESAADSNHYPDYEYRCGVWMILQILHTASCHVLFCEDEEVGCVGAKKFTSGSLRPQVNYIVELDRRGSNDAVFYRCDNPEFEGFVTSFGFETASGSCSDISYIAPYLETAAVNISCGYYCEHQRHEYICLEEMELNAARVAQMVTQQTEHFEYRERQDSFFGGRAYQYSMWDTAFERETYKWLSPLPKEAKIKLGTAELIMPHAKIDRQRKVHRYIPELSAAVLTENAVAIMPNGKKPVYDTKKSKCHKVIPLAQALELLRCK